MNKKAFTLAEVLITLTIIGVIAALTIPNLMQSYRKHQVEVGIKEAYSILSNAIKMSVAEGGDLVASKTTYYSNVPYVENRLLPYLKVGKICGLANGYVTKVLNTGCFLKHDSKYWYWKYLNGKNSTTNDTGIYTSNNFYTFILQNGMHVGVFPWNSSNHIVYVVDINGEKGPAIVGNDLFFFSVDSNDWTKLNIGYVHDNFSVQLNDNCKLTGLGTTCAYTIFKNGWKIPDNYPVKKW